MKQHSTQKAVALSCVYLGWGSLYFAIRIAVQTIPPFLLAGSSSVLAGILLMWLSKAPMPTAVQWKAALGPALFLILLGNGLIVWAEQFIPSAMAALILASEPAWLILLDRVVFKGPKMSGFQVAGVCLGMVGVGLLMAADKDLWLSTDISRTHAYGAGILAIVVAAAGWSLGSLLCRSKDLPINPAMAIALPVLLGGVALLGASYVSGEIQAFDFAQVSRASAISYMYIVLVSYVATYTSYAWLLKHAPLAQVSTYAYVNPLVAAFLGVVVGGEKLSGWAFVGGAVILAATFLILQRKKRSTTHESQ